VSVQLAPETSQAKWLRARSFALATAALPALLALGCLLSCRSRGAPSKPFTRESAIGELRDRYPQASLPADILPEGVLAEESLTFDASVEPPLALDVYRPRAEGLHPAVIIVHGGGWERGARTMERPFAKRLAALGFVTVPVSYRLGPQGRFPNALFDLKNAVRWLRANAGRFSLDPQRVFALGGSSGGQLVALLGASNGVSVLEGPGQNRERSSSVQAVVDIDGLADFTGPALLEKERQTPGAPTRFLGGSYEARSAVWRDASALSHVGPHSAPTLFINSTAPTPILPGRREMVDKLARAGVDAKLMTLPDTPHPFWLMNPWFEPTLRATEQFLREQLRKSDEQGLDPAKENKEK
jgi:pectinesterase